MGRIDAVRQRAALIHRQRLASRVEKARWSMGRGSRNSARRQLEEDKQHTAKNWLVVIAIMAFLRRTLKAAEPGLEIARTQRIMEKYVFLIQSTFRKYARRMKQRLQKGAWVRQRIQAAHLVAKFLRDHSGLQQGLARYVSLFRGKVMRVQKLFRGYIQITRSRMRVLSVSFDALVARRYSMQVEEASR